MSNNGSRWVLGTCMTLFSLFGLFTAARAVDDTFYWTGLFFFLIGAATVFNLVRQSYDEAEGRHVERHLGVPLLLLFVGLGTVLFHVLSPWWWAPIASNWQYIDTTIDLTFWITGTVFTAIMLFMAYCAYRFRRRDGHRAEYEPESARLEWGLTIVTAVGVAAMLAPGLVVWNQFVSVPDDAVEVEVVGQQWSWNFRLPGADGRLGTSDTRRVDPGSNPLGLNPNDPAGGDDLVVEAADLHLKVGQPVKLLLRSVDVLHDFYVPEFRAKMDLVPGLVSYIWLTPTRTGTFDILCAELCGTGHSLMRGRVVVDDEESYQAWLQGQQTFAQLAARARGKPRVEAEPEPAEPEVVALPVAGSSAPFLQDRKTEARRAF